MLSGGKTGLVSAELLRREQQEFRRQDGSSKDLEGESLVEYCPPLPCDPSLGSSRADARSAVFPQDRPRVPGRGKTGIPLAQSKEVFPRVCAPFSVLLTVTRIVQVLELPVIKKQMLTRLLCRSVRYSLAPVSFLGEAFTSLLSLYSPREQVDFQPCFGKLVAERSPLSIYPQ